MQIRLQAAIRGFTGKSATVYAMYDPETGLCIVGKVGKGNADRQSGSILISDVERDSPVDDFYNESDISPSIADYYNMINDNQLLISDKVRVADPQNNIEFDGIKSGKKDYRVMGTITNAQVAVLAISRYIAKSKKIEQVIDFSSNFNEAMKQGFSVTI